MKHFHIAFIFLCLLSCHTDIKNITVQGIVMDETTKRSIENAKVTVICWKYGDTPDESYTEREELVTNTDSHGNYKFEFDKGAFIELKVSADGYIEEFEAREIHRKKNFININLRNTSN